MDETPDASDNVVSMAAHVKCRTGLNEAPAEVPAPAAPAEVVPIVQPRQLRGFSMREIGDLVNACTRSGSSRTRRNAARLLGHQVEDLQRAFVEFRAAAQRFAANGVTLQDAALAVLRVSSDSVKDLPLTPAEERIRAEVTRLLGMIADPVQAVKDQNEALIPSALVEP